MSDGLLERLEARLASPKLTPMMRQYLTVKSDHPEALVFFRMGDFFETFFEDAEECARRLDITLTARSKEQDIPMAGVPHHAVNGYLGRLVQQGCTVVLVDQVEDPRQAKGLVRREITRVITPGTFVDPDAPPRVANYLVSLGLPKSRQKQGWALAALDLATGDFRATSGSEDDHLIDELARLQPKELLLNDSQASHPLVASIHASQPDILLTRLDARDYSTPAVLRALAKVLGQTEVDSLSKLLPSPAVHAAARAVAYAEQTQLRSEAPDLRGRPSLGHIRELRPYVFGEALILDREAREHLELFLSSRGDTKGALIDAVDRAVTPMGGRMLRDWLAYPPRRREVIQERHRAVAALSASPAELDQLREALARVADIERLVGRVVLGRALARDLVQLRGSLEAGPEVLELARRVSRGGPELIEGQAMSSRLSLLSEVDSCTDVAGALEVALLDEPANDPGAGDVFRDGFDEELDKNTRLSREGKRLIAELEQREKEATGITSLKVRSNRVFGYYIEVTKANLTLVPDRFIRKQTTVNSERFFTDELKTLEDDVLNAEERRVARTEELLNQVIAQVADDAPRLRVLASTFAEIDVLSGFAHLAETQDWVRPEMHDGAEIELQEGRHPVLEQFSGELGERFVPNDVRLTTDERLMIITGPNMAGKSTIMRQTALIVILAYMGSFVPARSARIGRVDRVFTRVGASDDLSRGRSTFMVEMTETSRILRSATSHDLIIIDEIGRGTSTFDGLSIAWAVAEHLHDSVQARTMFATHYHELTELCRDKAQAVNRHVAVREHEEDIVFLRKLQPGATNRSYGVQVARLAGLPGVVVARARAVLDALEAQALRAGAGSPVQHLLTLRGGGAGQLTLFDRPELPAQSRDQPPEVRKLLDRLTGLDLDDLTPRQALGVLAELQAMLPHPQKDS